MDAESLAQVQEIVTTAFTSLRQEFSSGFAELRRDLEATRTGLRQEFTAGIIGLHQDLETTGTGLRQGIDATAVDLRQEMRSSAEEIKRHSGVLYEDMQHKLELVIEGTQFIRESIVDVRAEIAHESRETRALLKLSYEQLDRRVENIEQRLGPAS